MTEGCEFRDLHSEFEALGVTIYGASYDAAAVNKAFSTANDFQYRLFSDNADRDLAKHYGAYSVDFFADRVTVVIDPTGAQVLTYSVSDTKQHPHDVLADMNSILAD